MAYGIGFGFGFGFGFVQLKILATYNTIPTFAHVWAPETSNIDATESIVGCLVQDDAVVTSPGDKSAQAHACANETHTPKVSTVEHPHCSIVRDWTEAIQPPVSGWEERNKERVQCWLVCCVHAEGKARYD